MYGDIGKGFIHVHHLKPVSQIGETYEVDPINDLRPVCPNCHAMLHRPEETLTIEELKLMVTANVTELASR
jgi:5-methylcytosine-specific restriction protein A